SPRMFASIWPAIIGLVLLPLLSAKLEEYSSVSNDFLRPNIWPNGSHVLQAGSDVTFQCSGQAAANRRCSNLTLLYSPRGSDWQSASTTELLMINHSCRNHSLASFLLSNVSTFGGYTGWYWCGCTFTAADSANVSTSRLWVLSHPTRLLVGSKPRAANLSFYWLDRKVLSSKIHPAPSFIANASGVPPELGGSVSIRLHYYLGDKQGDCDNYNDRTGVCDWGLELAQSSVYIFNVTLTLCNQLQWCSTQLYEFDLRDKEKPSPVRKLALHFEPQQLNISWTAPSSPLPGNQEYSYQVLLSDGRSLATNSTAVSVAVSPDTEYSVTVRCRPRHFSGHWSDNSSGSGRSGEWLPCNPELDEAFLLPPNQLVFPASDRSCRNGRVLLYRVANLGTNQSETLAVSKKFSTASYLSIVLNSSMLSLKFESTLAIFASTSYGENSSLPNRSIHLPPLTAACSGGSDSQTFVSCLVNSTNLIADCNRSGHVTGNRGFSKETWQIRGSVACPVLPVSAFATAEGSSGFSSWYLVLLVVGSILIVSAIGVAMAVRRWTMRRRAEAVPLSDPQKYISEPDATLVSAGLPYDTAQSLLHQEDPSSAGSIEAPEGYVSR
ncbi:hypothetical protein BOX15_Mlig031173g2, partial [Macrostomum lignano]